MTALAGAGSAFSRRAFLGGVGGVGALGVLAALTACSPGGSGSGAGVLDVALWGDSSRADLYQQAIDMFLADNEGATATLQFADLGPYLERLATSAAARDLPDVLWMRDTHIGRYGSAGSLLDLSDYLGDVIDTSGIGDAAVADGTVAGGVFALPTHNVGQAVLHDAGRFSTLGIDMATALVTWQDLADLATEAADPSAGYFGIGDPTVDTTHRHLEAWIRQRGEELFDGEAGIGFSATTLEEWYEFWGSLRDSGVVPSADVMTESLSSGWTSSLMTTGRTAILNASTNHLGIVQDLTETPIGMTSLPADSGASDDWWFFPPILISVAGNTPDPELAASMVDFFVNDVDAAAITKLSQGAPSSSAVRESIAPLLSESETAFVEQISREQQQPRRPFPIRPEGSEAFNSALTRTGQEIAYGRLSIGEAVSALMADAPNLVSGS